MPFFLWWGWAWTAFAVYLLLGALTLPLSATWTPAVGALAFLATICGYLQPAFLMVGVASPAVLATMPVRTWRTVGMATALVAATVVFVVSLALPDALDSFAVRVAPRAWALAAAAAVLGRGVCPARARHAFARLSRDGDLVPGVLPRPGGVRRGHDGTTRGRCRRALRGDFRRWGGPAAAPLPRRCGQRLWHLPRDGAPPGGGLRALQTGARREPPRPARGTRRERRPASGNQGTPSRGAGASRQRRSLSRPRRAQRRPDVHARPRRPDSLGQRPVGSRAWLFARRTRPVQRSADAGAGSQRQVRRLHRRAQTRRGRWRAPGRHDPQRRAADVGVSQHAPDRRRAGAHRQRHGARRHRAGQGGARLARVGGQVRCRLQSQPLLHRDQHDGRRARHRDQRRLPAAHGLSPERDHRVERAGARTLDRPGRARGRGGRPQGAGESREPRGAMALEGRR